MHTYKREVPRPKKDRGEILGGILITLGIACGILIALGLGAMAHEAVTQHETRTLREANDRAHARCVDELRDYQFEENYRYIQQRDAINRAYHQGDFDAHLP